MVIKLVVRMERFQNIWRLFNLSESSFWGSKRLFLRVFIVRLGDGTAHSLTLTTHGHILIPRSIIHESKEYIITTIATSFGENTEIEMVDFPQNSEVETIESYAYEKFEQYSLNIPPKIKEIKYNWQTLEFHLDDVSISPDNKNFKILTYVIRQIRYYS